jgi:hypothetical protein
MRDGQWFVLVALGGELDRPRFYVIPRDHVAAMVYLGHRNWLVTPGRGGKPHNDNPQRILSEADVADCLERWDLLDSDTSDVPFLADRQWFLQLAEKHGLPDGHPGIGMSLDAMQE